MQLGSDRRMCAKPRPVAASLGGRGRLKRWTALTRFLDDGRLCMSNNAAERAVRCIAFAGSDEGGHRAAAIYTLIETAKLNDIDPQAWFTDVLAPLNVSNYKNSARSKKGKLNPSQKMPGLEWADRSSTFVGRILRRREGTRSRILGPRLRHETPGVGHAVRRSAAAMRRRLLIDRNWAGPHPSQKVWTGTLRPRNMH